MRLDLLTIGDAFVVVVVGGMGSIPGAFVAALLIAEIKALCVGIGTVHVAGIDFSFSKLTLVVEFLVMAMVLVLRPWGLMGKPQAASRNTSATEAPLRQAPRELREREVDAGDVHRADAHAQGLDLGDQQRGDVGAGDRAHAADHDHHEGVADGVAGPSRAWPVRAAAAARRPGRPASHPAQTRR